MIEMPIYKYECTRCFFELQEIQKITDDPLIECPTCKCDTLKKIIGKFASKLKGKGWYKDGYS